MEIQTPAWALPLLERKRYKGAKGGRGSGKSHFFAELCVEALILNADKKIVCIREIQKSLKYSAKALIEAKIKALDVGHLFEITQTEIRSRLGDGLIIFQGMQDHTSDSIKSLEGFDIAWVEEAQSLSARSLELLRPTIRKQGSEIWFSWNPSQDTDAVDKFMLDGQTHDDFCVVHVNYTDNPWLPNTLKAEADYDLKNNSATFDHVWLGAYNTKADAQVFAGKFAVDEFEATADWGGPYFGLDFGFSQDPTAAIRCWIADSCLFIDYESGGIGIELDKTADKVKLLPQAEIHAIRADSARPESISYLKRHGLPKIEAVKKGKGSVEDGIEFIRSFDKVIIHPRCEKTAQEFRLYSYAIDKRSGDILPRIEDKHNHYIDAIRYALEPMIKQKRKASQTKLKL